MESDSKITNTIIVLLLMFIGFGVWWLLNRQPEIAGPVDAPKPAVTKVAPQKKVVKQPAVKKPAINEAQDDSKIKLLKGKDAGAEAGTAVTGKQVVPGKAESPANNNSESGSAPPAGDGSSAPPQDQGATARTNPIVGPVNAANDKPTDKTPAAESSGKSRPVTVPGNAPNSLGQSSDAKAPEAGSKAPESPPASKPEMETGATPVTPAQ